MSMTPEERLAREIKAAFLELLQSPEGKELIQEIAKEGGLNLQGERHD